MLFGTCNCTMAHIKTHCRITKNKPFYKQIIQCSLPFFFTYFTIINYLYHIFDSFSPNHFSSGVYISIYSFYLLRYVPLMTKIYLVRASDLFVPDKIRSSAPCGELSDHIKCLSLGHGTPALLNGDSTWYEIITMTGKLRGMSPNGSVVWSQIIWRW